MIIDVILDTQIIADQYNANEFLAEIKDYAEIWPETAAPIINAMEAGTNSDVQKALCKYVRANGYNTAVCRFIKSFQWI